MSFQYFNILYYLIIYTDVNLYLDKNLAIFSKMCLKFSCSDLKILIFCAVLSRVPVANTVTLLYQRRYQNAPHGAFIIFVRNKNQMAFFL